MNFVIKQSEATKGGHNVGVAFSSGVFIDGKQVPLSDELAFKIFLVPDATHDVDLNKAISDHKALIKSFLLKEIEGLL